MHIPVLLKESIECLSVKPDGVYIDATVGFGGHSKEILKKLGKNGSLIGIDTDQRAIEIAENNLMEFKGSYSLIHGNFFEIERIANDVGVKSVDGILFDLGVSSLHLSDNTRGFSFALNGPLDMRMDKSISYLTADDIVNTYTQEKLLKIFYEYGEERWSKKIVDNLIRERATKRIESTAELAELVAKSIPRKFWPPKIHPATRIFQALRIEVNDELNHLKAGIESAFNLLEIGGRMVVISFHSLEDRIVKHFFNENKDKLNILTKKPVIASVEETNNNPRSRSAKLRAVEKQEYDPQ